MNVRSHPPQCPPDHRLRTGIHCPKAAIALALIGTAARPAVGQDGLHLEREVAAVQRHLETPQLAAALEFVEGQQADPSDVIQDWIGVCNAYGPSGDELYRARHIYKMFRIYGLERVYIDANRNVVAVRPGTGEGPTVVLNAHHDAVALWPKDQPIEAFEREGRIYCPAAGDDLPGVVQLLTVLRAMNAAEVETRGDVWFVTFSGEESGSWGAEHFARGNYPHNLDWREGDAIVQLHGGAGVGATTGSTPIINIASLYFFTPFERRIPGAEGADRRWRPHAVDLLSRVIGRIRAELTDPRGDCLRCTGEDSTGERSQWYINMADIQASPIVNRPSSEARVRMDLRAETWAQMRQLHQQIMMISGEVCAQYETQGFPPHEYADRCGFAFRIDEVYGREDDIPGWDKTDNPQARMVAAAGHALYGFPPTIDPERGCGDCRNMYKVGMPAISFRGDVIDLGGGRIERGAYGRRGGHDVTESQSVSSIWAGIKHALVFAAAYAGMPEVEGLARR